MTATTNTRMTQRTLPWYGVSTSVVDGLQTAEETLAAADLDWDIKVIPTYGRVRVDGKERQVKSRRRSVVRMDTLTEIGSVGRVYEAFPNREAFKFLDNVAQSGDAKFEAAGSQEGGAKIFVVMKLPRLSIVGDDTDPYVLFRTAHDGSMSVTATTTAVRVACTNMFRGIMASDTPVFKATHRESALDPEVLAAAARQSLGLANKGIEKFAVIAEQLTEVAISTEDEFEAIMRKAFPWENKVRDKEVAGINQLWHESELVPDDFRNTGWGLLNATTEFLSHERVSRSEDARFKRALGVNGQIETWMTQELLDWRSERVMVAV